MTFFLSVLTLIVLMFAFHLAGLRLALYLKDNGVSRELRAYPYAAAFLVLSSVLTFMNRIDGLTLFSFEIATLIFGAGVFLFHTTLLIVKAVSTSGYKSLSAKAYPVYEKLLFKM
ncbi:hypothetical protein CR205_12150 [Alteribacter lacisalsi]|uniref:Uncharacterized protein n=1 Tax=Alteribacter lacisalsi TaxID=2045244 RepID=A0A2W0HGC1_9BACI|nr:hypothetical protein [Alteribacter lacisalsi]PYZ96465.1 hypothetical protein CR205_12150 [Alteribacter lacisalsi]